MYKIAYMLIMFYLQVHTLHCLTKIMNIGSLFPNDIKEKPSVNDIFFNLM